MAWAGSQDIQPMAGPLRRQGWSMDDDTEVGTREAEPIESSAEVYPNPSLGRHTSAPRYLLVNPQPLDIFPFL